MITYLVKKRYLSKLAKQSKSYIKKIASSDYDYLYDRLKQYVIDMMECDDADEVMWKIADDYFEETPDYVNKTRDEIITDIKFKTSKFLQKSDIVTLCTRHDKKSQKIFDLYDSEEEVQDLKDNVLSNLIVRLTNENMSEAEKLVDEKLQESKKKTAKFKHLRR